MKIGFDASRAFSSQNTGTENYSTELLKALAKISVFGEKKLSYRIYVRNSNYEAENWPRNFEFKKIGLPRFWTQLGLALECLVNPPDVLFIPAHTLPVIRRPNLPTVVTIHDLGAQFLPNFHKFGGLHLLWATRYAVKASSAIIAVSENTKKDLVERLNADPKKIFVVYEGVDEQEFEIKNNEFHIKKVLEKYKIEKPYILFVGTIQPRKNLVRLIKAFSLMIKNPKLKSLQLVIAGKKGWLFDEILASPAKFGVGNKVKFCGFVKDYDLPYIYSAASVFVMPSLVEGFGLPILEAAASGIPIAASNRTSLSEVAGTAAIYFNPENVAEIENSLEKILTDENLRKKLIEAGKVQIKKFSWEKTAKETLKILHDTYERSKS